MGLVWSSYVFGSLAIAFGRERLYRRSRASTLFVLVIAAAQGPVHAYSIFTLRRYNETLLTSGSTERQWGFGQIVAMILLGTNIVVLGNGIQGKFCCMLRIWVDKGLENSKLMVFVRLS